MIEKKEFSKCLGSLLSILGISINRLAKAINVDSSLANRWVNGKRIPSYKTVYIENITEYLAKNIKNSIQKQQINELFLGMFEDTKAIDNFEDKIKSMLYESQGYSIENKKNDKKNEKEKSIVKNKVRIFDTKYRKNQRISSNQYIEWNANNTNNVLDFSNEDKIIIGNDNIFSAGISILEFAAKKGNENNNRIYITYNNGLDMASQNSDYVIRFKSALLKSVENGWNVVFLFRLDGNINKTVRIINFIKPLLVTGKFSLYYVDKYDIFDTSKESIIVSGIGALSCYHFKAHPKLDSAFYFRSKAAVEVLENNFDIFLSTYGKPILKYFSQDNGLNYSYCLVNSENNTGNRFLYKYNLSILTIPKNLYMKFLNKKGLTEDEIQVALDFYDRRVNAFIQNVQIYEYFDIYYIDFINELINYRKFSLYDYTGIDIIDLELMDIVEILNNLIYLLETYSNYKIVLISKDIDNIIEDTEIYCVVKERQAVLLEAHNPSRAHQVRLIINEPTIVIAFEEYFKGIIKKTSPFNKDKKEVISWIKRQICLIQSSYSNELFSISYIIYLSDDKNKISYKSN